MRKSDLHIHTTFSDGVLTPQEVLKWASKKNLTDIAITDHDTTEGVEEAIKAGLPLDINVIPGMELSCVEQGEEIHILAYYLDYKSTRLKEFTKTLKEARIDRNIKIIEKLNKMEIDISINDVKEISKEGNMGRPHIAKALINKGLVDTVDGAFKIYLGRGKPAYVERYKITSKEGIDLIHSLGGVAVIAHPGLVSSQRVVNYVLNQNIDGIEVVHCNHTKEQIKYFSNKAKELNLIETAGSDCHGYLDEGIPKLGQFFTNRDVAKLLKEKADFYRKML